MPTIVANGEGDSGTTPFTFTVTRDLDARGRASVDFAFTPSGNDPVDSNDLVAGPFPLSTTLGSFADDSMASTDPLTLYRLLLNGTDDAGNVLRAVKSTVPGSVDLTY